MVVRVGALLCGWPQGIQTDLASSLSGRYFIMLKKIQVFVQAFSKYWELEEMPLYVYKSQGKNILTPLANSCPCIVQSPSLIVNPSPSVKNNKKQEVF
jgi:hypothetical protein